MTDHGTYVAAALGLPEREFISLMPAAGVSIVPAQVGAAGRTGTAIDVGGAPVKQVELVIGALSQGATFEMLVEDSADGQTFSAVQGGQISGTNPIAIDATSSALRRLAYSGTGRFLRTSVTSTGGNNPTVWMTARILTAPGVSTDELSLANLTTLAKWALLRRLANRPVDDLRRLIALSGTDPLAAGAGPEVLLAMLDERDALATAGLSISAADELLRGPSPAAADILEQQAETLLTAIRSANRAIQDESTVAPAQSSMLLAKVLSSIGWDEQLIARVLRTDVLAIAWEDYDVGLSALPGGVTLSATLNFDAAEQRLTASRSVRPSTLRTALEPLLAQATGDFQQALTAIDSEAALREAALADAQALLRAVSLPTHRVSVGAAAVTAFDVPDEWERRFFYDREAGDLCLTGWMTTADADAIKRLFSTAPVVNFNTLVDGLRNASSAYQPAAGNALVVREGTAGQLTVEALLLDTEGLQVPRGRPSRTAPSRLAPRPPPLQGRGGARPGGRLRPGDRRSADLAARRSSRRRRAGQLCGARCERPAADQRPRDACVPHRLPRAIRRRRTIASPRSAHRRGRPRRGRSSVAPRRLDRPRPHRHTDPAGIRPARRRVVFAARPLRLLGLRGVLEAGAVAEAFAAAAGATIDHERLAAALTTTPAPCICSRPRTGSALPGRRGSEYPPSSYNWPSASSWAGSSACPPTCWSA